MSAKIEIDEALYKALLRAAKDLVDAVPADGFVDCYGDAIDLKREMNAMQQAIDNAELRGPLVTL